MGEQLLRDLLGAHGAFASQNLVSASFINLYVEKGSRRRLNLALNLGFILEFKKAQLCGGLAQLKGQ